MIGGETANPRDDGPDDSSSCGYCGHRYDEHSEIIGCTYVIEGSIKKFDCDCLEWKAYDAPADNEPTSRAEAEQP